MSRITISTQKRKSAPRITHSTSVVKKTRDIDQDLAANASKIWMEALTSTGGFTAQQLATFEKGWKKFSAKEKLKFTSDLVVAATNATEGAALGGPATNRLKFVFLSPSQFAKMVKITDEQELVAFFLNAIKGGKDSVYDKVKAAVAETNPVPTMEVVAANTATTEIIDPLAPTEPIVPDTKPTPTNPTKPTKPTTGIAAGSGAASSTGATGPATTQAPTSTGATGATGTTTNKPPSTSTATGTTGATGTTTNKPPTSTGATGTTTNKPPTATGATGTTPTETPTEPTASGSGPCSTFKPTPEQLGDLNGDGKVDMLDVEEFEVLVLLETEAVLEEAIAQQEEMAANGEDTTELDKFIECLSKLVDGYEQEIDEMEAASASQETSGQDGGDGGDGGDEGQDGSGNAAADLGFNPNAETMTLPDGTVVINPSTTIDIGGPE